MSRIHILLSILLFISSCSKDNTTSPTGDDRERYLGSWICKETLQGQSSTTFTITVSSYGQLDTLLVNNFNNLGSGTTTIWLVSDNSITIPQQSITQVSINGFGFYSNNKLNLTYQADGESLSAICSQ